MKGLLGLLLVFFVVATADQLSDCFNYCMVVDGSDSYCSFRCQSNVPFMSNAFENSHSYDRCFSVCRAARTVNGVRDDFYMDDCATTCKRSDAQSYAGALFDEYCESIPGMPVEGCVNRLANLTQASNSNDATVYSATIGAAHGFFSHVHIVTGVDVKVGDTYLVGDVLLPDNCAGVLMDNVKQFEESATPSAPEEKFQYAQFRGYMGEEFVGTWSTYGEFQVENSLSIEMLYASNSGLYDENDTPLFVDDWELAAALCEQVTGESYERCVDVFDNKETVDEIMEPIYQKCSNAGISRRACGAALIAADMENTGANGFFKSICRAFKRVVRSVVRVVKKVVKTVTRLVGGVFKAITAALKPTKKVVNRTVAVSVASKTMEYEADEIVFPKAVDPSEVGKDMIKQAGKVSCSKPCSPSEFTEGVIIKVGKLLDGVTKSDERWLKGSMCVRCAQFSPDSRGQEHLARLKDINQNSEISLMSNDGRYVRSSARMGASKNSAANARFDVLVGPAEKLQIQGLDKSTTSKKYIATDAIIQSGNDVELVATNGGGHVTVAQNNMVWLDREYTEERARNAPKSSSQQFAGIPISDFTILKIFGQTMDRQLTHGDTVAFMYQSANGPRFLCQEGEQPAHLIEGRAFCTQFKILQSTIAVLEELGITIYY